MRSLAEILFRARQVIVNARLLWFPPAAPDFTALTGPLASWPDPPCAADIEQLAEQILRHESPLLGLGPVAVGDSIRWRRDPVFGKETGLEYFRRIPYLDFALAGDHKVIWELNRHQHLVVLAQGFTQTGRREFVDEIARQLGNWMDQNPFQRGINWASALEVAFRALSWLWILHLVGRDLSVEFRRRWLVSLYQHGLHLEHNLSVYFSPNTHLLGEAVALHALGLAMTVERWRTTGAAVLEEQLTRQVRGDGSHLEQSSYYHLYATDLFAFHAALAEPPPAYRQKLARMLEYLDALVSTQGILALIGDEDGGRLFHPYGDRRRFASETLARSAMRVRRSEGAQWFPDAGIAVLRSERAHVIFDAGSFGAGTAGHSHADTLSLVAFDEGAELLIDPGTYTYVADPTARERYRGTRAHNTIYIHGVEQATPQGPFRWSDPPKVEVLRRTEDTIDARASYGGFTHRRTIVFRKPDFVIVLDRVDGPAGDYTVEQRWLTPAGADPSFLATEPAAFQEPAERSCAFGSSEPAVRFVARRQGTLPMVFAAVIGFGKSPGEIKVTKSSGAITVCYADGEMTF